MPHTVELIVETGELADEMAEVRAWLDHKRCVPLKFAATPHLPGWLALRIEFADAGEADACAQMFGGQVAASESGAASGRPTATAR